MVNKVSGKSDRLFKRKACVEHKERPNAKYLRRSIPKAVGLDPYSVILSPLCTETALKKMEKDNTLVFLCNIKATKPDIRKAILEIYELKCMKVNTLIRPDGIKKAYVRLGKDDSAMEVATRLGLIK